MYQYDSISQPEPQWSENYNPKVSADKSSLNLEGYAVFFETLIGYDRIIKFCPFKISGKKKILAFRQKEIMKLLDKIRTSIHEETYSSMMELLFNKN